MLVNLQLLVQLLLNQAVVVPCEVALILSLPLALVAHILQK